MTILIMDKERGQDEETDNSSNKNLYWRVAGLFDCIFSYNEFRWKRGLDYRHIYMYRPFDFIPATGNHLFQTK